MVVRRMRQVQQMQQAQQAQQIQQIQHMQQAQQTHKTQQSQQKQHARLSNTPLPTLQTQPGYQYEHASGASMMEQTSVPVKLEHPLPPTPWPTPNTNSPSDTGWMASIDYGSGWSSALGTIGDSGASQFLTSGSANPAQYSNSNSQATWSGNNALQQAILSLDSWPGSGMSTSSFDNMNVEGGEIL